MSGSATDARDDNYMSVKVDRWQNGNSECYTDNRKKFII